MAELIPNLLLRWKSHFLHFHSNSNLFFIILSRRINFVNFFTVSWARSRLSQFFLSRVHNYHQFPLAMRTLFIRSFWKWISIFCRLEIIILPIMRRETAMWSRPVALRAPRSAPAAAQTRPTIPTPRIDQRTGGDPRPQHCFGTASLRTKKNKQTLSWVYRSPFHSVIP